MSKVKVSIEEHLCRTIEIEVPSIFDDDEDGAMMYAEKKAKEMYHNKEIILDADDHNGIGFLEIELEDGTCTNWFDM